MKLVFKSLVAAATLAVMATGAQAQEAASLQDLLDQGLTDLFRDRYPDAQEFSWWDYRGGAFHRKHGLRIDFLLATETLQQTTTEVVIDREYRRKIEDLTPSDHAPVFADLDI